jgi:hypothetical protein
VSSVSDTSTLIATGRRSTVSVAGTRRPFRRGPTAARFDTCPVESPAKAYEVRIICADRWTIFPSRSMRRHDRGQCDWAFPISAVNICHLAGCLKNAMNENENEERRKTKNEERRATRHLPVSRICWVLRFLRLRSSFFGNRRFASGRVTSGRCR